MRSLEIVEKLQQESYESYTQNRIEKVRTIPSDNIRGGSILAPHSTVLFHRQACTRKSHCGCATRASEKRREQGQGVFPLWFGIAQYCVVNI